MAKQPTNTADSIINEIRSFALKSPQNRMPTAKTEFIFDEPLVQFADGDDPIFTEYKSIIAATHLTPREALAQAYNKKPDDMPERLSVISWILPFTEKTRRSNRSQTHGPSRLWSHARWFGEKFNDALRQHVVELLTGRGYLAVAPALPPFIKLYENEKGLYSSWSERHIAYAAGLGTFSLSDGFITERGIAHRCGSVVTSMELPTSPRKAAGPYANCLFYANEKCGICIERCPVQALTEQGHDKNKCWQHLRDLGYRPEKLKGEYDIKTSVIGCGLCQTKVPCEAVNPTR